MPHSRMATGSPSTPETVDASELFMLPMPDEFDARRLHAAEAAGVEEALALAPGALVDATPEPVFGTLRIFAGERALAGDNVYLGEVAVLETVRNMVLVARRMLPLDARRGTPARRKRT